MKLSGNTPDLDDFTISIVDGKSSQVSIDTSKLTFSKAQITKPLIMVAMQRILKTELARHTMLDVDSRSVTSGKLEVCHLGVYMF